MKKRGMDEWGTGCIAKKGSRAEQCKTIVLVQRRLFVGWLVAWMHVHQVLVVAGRVLEDATAAKNRAEKTMNSSD